MNNSLWVALVACGCYLAFPVYAQDPDYVGMTVPKTTLLIDNLAPGETTTKERFALQPKSIILPECDQAQKYTLAMYDPKAKPPTYRHWLVLNTPVDKQCHLLVKNGDTPTPYAGPTPPAGTGPHQYVFLVFQQTQPNLQSAVKGERSGWNPLHFASKHDLGEPVASNWFIVNSN